MNFSELRHRVTFQKPSGVTQNGMGENVPVYVDFATVWACVSPMTGREYAESQKIRAETTYKVTARYCRDIVPEMKILFRGRTLDIVSVLNIGERNTTLEIIAADGDVNGGK
jgi:SPP1 family predicted phage head-tail adaptor